MHFLDTNPSVAKKVIDKGLTAARAREAARKHERRCAKGQTGGGLPGKLADCSDRDPVNTELYIVEVTHGGRYKGATGSSRRFSIRGKLINVEKAV